METSANASAPTEETTVESKQKKTIYSMGRFEKRSITGQPAKIKKELINLTRLNNIQLR